MGIACVWRRASRSMVPAILAVVWAMALPASAKNTWWQCDPCTPGDWFDAGNWAAGVPGADDRACIDNGGTAEIASGQAAAFREHVGFGGWGTLSHSGGTNTVVSELGIGYEAGGDGTYELSGTGQLWATDEYVGRNGTGRFVQTGGISTIASWLALGFYSDSNGTYELEGAGQLSAGCTFVGFSGTGRFVQTGGTSRLTHLKVAFGSTGHGTYELSGTGQLWAAEEVIREGGEVIQAGGLNRVRGYFEVEGTYELSGTGRLRVGGDETIGWEGTGSFVQDGGTHTVVGGEICLGQEGGSTGTYELRGGLLAGDELFVGVSGTGRFIQAGGTVELREELVLGENSASSGTYELSGGRLLVTECEDIGEDGSGTFLQTGGENRARCLWVAEAGRYVQTGGTLDVGWSLTLAGEWDFDASSADVTWENVVVDFSQGDVRNAQNASLTLQGANSLVILAPGQDPNDWFAEYHNEGLTHTTDGPLVIPAGTTRTWRGVINVPVHCQGTLSPPPGDGLFLAGGVTIDGNGAVLLGPGELCLSDGISRLDGNGHLQADEIDIGEGGTATFIQTGGTNTLVELCLSGEEGDVITYRLEGGVLQADLEIIGDEGVGVFLHSGGSNTVGKLLVGYEWEESWGRYELSGTGRLRVTGEVRIVHHGDAGGSSFLQDSGTHTVDRLQIGWDNLEGPASPPNRYVLTGGTLEVLSGLVLIGGGEFALDECSMDLTWEDVVLDFSGGQVVGAPNASLTVLGADSLVVLNPDQAPGEWFGEFTNAGWTHMGGTPLVVPDANSHTWAGEIQEHVICEGRIAAPPGKGLHLTGGLELRAGAAVDLGTGKLVVHDGDSNMAAGSQLTANEEFIGYPNGGTFTQTGGNQVLNFLVLGSHRSYEEEESTFNLAGGTLTAGVIFIGGGDDDLLSNEAEDLCKATLNLTGGVLDVGELRMRYSTAWMWEAGKTNPFHFTGGTLKVGRMNFDLEQRGGVLAPGRSVGRTTIDGSYAQYAGALAIELGGNDNGDANHPQYDVLEVAGAVYLAGSLELNWLPTPGDANSAFGGEYDLLVYGGGLLGEFAEFGGNIDPVYIANIDYAFDLGDGNSAVRVELYDLLSGDADLDGRVGRDDLLRLQRGFGSPDADWFDGDFNFDGRVDFRDYLMWKAHAGDSVAPGEAPDPATFALLAVGGSLALFRRRRRKVPGPMRAPGGGVSWL